MTRAALAALALWHRAQASVSQAPQSWQSARSATTAAAEAKDSVAATFVMSTMSACS
ncbi:MAG: hypothetical protein ACI88C_002715 [Acidimicrobiales bacterium]|jgi:hypothetical protein